MKSDTHLAMMIVFGLLFAFIFSMLFTMVVSYHKPIPDWGWGSVVVLTILTYTNWREYIRKSNQEQQLTKQTIHLENTKEIETRNIVQITSSDGRIYALCSDGTLWGRAAHNTAEWYQISGIPAN